MTYLIQPPKSKGEKVSEVFPYVKYTSVKSYSFNKPDSVYYADSVISIQEVYKKDFLDDEFLDDEKRWKAFSKTYYIARNGTDKLIVKNGKPTESVIEHSKLTLK